MKWIAPFLQTAMAQRAQQRRLVAEGNRLRAELAAAERRLAEVDLRTRLALERLASQRLQKAEEIVVRIAGDQFDALVSHGYQSWRPVHAEIDELETTYGAATRN